MKKTLLLTAALCLALCVCAAGCVGNDEPSTDGGASSGEKIELKTGDTPVYGSYLGESIEWQVLSVDKENEKALLISKDLVSYWVFDSAVMQDVTWETSDIREWLNTDFYNAAFTEEEKARVLVTDLSNPANPKSGIGAGANTEDKVFLLSYGEAQRYFPTDESRQACYDFSASYQAALAKMIGNAPEIDMSEEQALGELDGLSNGRDWPDSWWLRTSGSTLESAAGVSSDGVIEEDCNQVWSLQGIRPAFWLDVSPDEQETP